MTAPSPRSVWSVLGLLALAASVASAEPTSPEPVETGSRIAPFSLPDQHGETRAVDASTRLILFSHDMDGGKVIREVLGDDGAALLARHEATYVADVHRMPGLVRRFVSLPRMRRRPYPVLLDETGPTTRDLPRREDSGTLLFLEDLQVRRVEFVATPEALRELLGEGAPAGAGEQ